MTKVVYNAKPTTSTLTVLADTAMECTVEINTKLQKLRTEIRECDEEVAIGDFNAYWYQKYAARAFAMLLEANHKRIALLQPTGSGKTNSAGLIFIDPAIRLLLGVGENEKMRVLFCSHRHQLLRQATDAYASLSDRVEIATQSIGSQFDQSVVQNAHLIVLDEAHHETTMTFQSHLENLSSAVILGMSAGLERLDNRLCKFSAFIEPLSRQQAVEEGYLADSYIRTICGPADVEACLFTIEQWSEEMGQTMIFLRTKAECRKLYDTLQDLGIGCALAVDISEEHLNSMMKGFAAKEFQFLISCMKLGEGIDVKGCTGVLIGRNLVSRSLLNQIIGRGSRRDSECRVYEFVTLTNSDNLTAIDIIGIPERHTIHYRVGGNWNEREISY